MVKHQPTDDIKRRLNMSRIRSKNTSIEVALRRALWRAGIRYRKNFHKLPGSPDIAITKYQIAIFCDGEFWHGKDWEKKKTSIKSNREFWIEKIERNRSRDRSNEWALNCMGWVVLRFWGQEIKKDLAGCIKEIKCAILRREVENAD